MAVGPDDVRHIAALARLGLDEARIPSLVEELNGILDHMEVLGKVETSSATMTGARTAETSLRPDGGVQTPLLRARASFAPQMRDGFFLVPRLATHADVGATDEEAEA